MVLREEDKVSLKLKLLMLLQCPAIETAAAAVK
ncbi:hypothetical protein OnM2_093029 [Erysiphe neolycopersici]|uniref:Uncharacterized protein n=1 Tax=Erysiphe neolycopersici TaxID=212602 RepID=A0A420HC15_9PEZI|nr:hypothetical protein OnM2_093029 [Erysiphe neolycopersici]